MQQSSPLAAAHWSFAFLCSNYPIRSRLSFSGNLVFGGKCNVKYDWLAANNYMVRRLGRNIYLEIKRKKASSLSVPISPLKDYY